jgi:bromodomain and WD repeat domain-containing protein 1/3
MLVATVQGMVTLLGAGRQSLLRTVENISRPRSALEYCTRLNGAPPLDALNRSKSNNITSVLFGRQAAGPLLRKQAVASNFYSKVSLLRETLGHLSAVYCVLFDRSGKHIVTVRFLVKCSWILLLTLLFYHRERTICWSNCGVP